MLPRRTPAELRIRDRQQADARVRENEPLLKWVLKKYFPDLWELGECVADDVYAIGLACLMRADRDYNPERGKFSTLATTYIVNATKNEIASYKRRRRRRAGELHDAIPDGREMDPLAALVTLEQIRRQSTESMFGEPGEGSDVEV